MNLRKKFLIFIKINKLKLIEYIRFDSKLFQFLLFLFYTSLYFLTKSLKNRFKGLIWTGKMFRHTRYKFARNFATSKLLYELRKSGMQKVGDEMRKIVQRKIDKSLENRLKQSVFETKFPVFDKRMIILSPPSNQEKGTILIKYTEYFKYFLSIFDLEKISTDYILITEPSWCGYFDETILCLLFEKIPIVIQALEPIDYQFIKSLNANFYPVDVGANCWVNPDIFFPIKGIEKRYDIIMVGIWADFKRHYHLFEALSKCKKRLKVVLVGQPWPKTLEEIKDEARYYGVIDQIEFFENIPQSELNILFNQSKCALLLSKKEGFNKSIIEAMYANTPAFILEGFNYGYKYPFINKKTGGFIKASKLVEFLDNIDIILSKNKPEPAKYIKKYISPWISIQKIIKALEEIEKKEQIKINKDLRIKVNTPDLDYLDPKEWKNMWYYYEQLRWYLR